MTLKKFPHPPSPYKQEVLFHGNPLQKPCLDTIIMPTRRNSKSLLETKKQ